MLGISAPAEGATVTPEQRDKIVRMQGDLIWLVREGYVTEFIDGGLYAPPAMVEARKKEVEAEENDPENFPEAPRSSDSRPPMSESRSPAADSPSPSVEAPAAEEAPDIVEPPAPVPDAPRGVLRGRPPSGRLGFASAAGSSAGRRPRCPCRGARRRRESIRAASPATRRRGTTG